MQEYASKLRSTMIERCRIAIGDIPQWPGAPECPLNTPPPQAPEAQPATDD